MDFFIIRNTFLELADDMEREDADRRAIIGKRSSSLPRSFAYCITDMDATRTTTRLKMKKKKRRCRGKGQNRDTTAGVVVTGNVSEMDIKEACAAFRETLIRERWAHLTEEYLKRSGENKPTAKLLAVLPRPVFKHFCMHLELKAAEVRFLQKMGRLLPNRDQMVAFFATDKDLEDSQSLQQLYTHACLFMDCWRKGDFLLQLPLPDTSVAACARCEFSPALCQSDLMRKAREVCKEQGLAKARKLSLWSLGCELQGKLDTLLLKYKLGPGCVVEIRYET